MLRLQEALRELRLSQVKNQGGHRDSVLPECLLRAVAKLPALIWIFPFTYSTFSWIHVSSMVWLYYTFLEKEIKIANI